MRLPYIVAGIIILVSILLAVVWTQKAPTQPIIQSATPLSRTYEMPVLLSQQSFVPKNLSIAEGDTLTLKIRSIDMNHSVFVPLYKIGTSIAQQQISNITFTADRKGTVSILCNDRCDPGVVLTVFVQ